MKKTAQVTRLIALAILFGGSAAVVFTAVVLVKAAKANGVEVSEAAFRNGPAFIQFGKVAAGAAIALVIAESLNFIADKKKQLGKSQIAQYAMSTLCAAAVFVFAFAIVPPMEKLLPDIKTNQAAHEEFHKLHETSRAVFGASIVFALISLVMPAMAMKKEEEN